MTLVLFLPRQLPEKLDSNRSSVIAPGSQKWCNNKIFVNIRPK